jgi:hypothetical protein
VFAAVIYCLSAAVGLRTGLKFKSRGAFIDARIHLAWAGAAFSIALVTILGVNGWPEWITLVVLFGVLAIMMIRLGQDIWSVRRQARCPQCRHRAHRHSVHFLMPWKIDEDGTPEVVIGCQRCTCTRNVTLSQLQYPWPLPDLSEMGELE